MESQEIERLKSKNYLGAIIRNICRDFNMLPIIANAYYKQMEKYFEEHLQTNKENHSFSRSQVFFRLTQNPPKTIKIETDYQPPRRSNKNPAVNVHWLFLRYQAILTNRAIVKNNKTSPILVAKTYGFCASATPCIIITGRPC